MKQIGDGACTTLWALQMEWFLFDVQPLSSIGVYDTMRQIFIRVHLETKIMFWLATHLALVQLTYNNDRCLHETGHFQDSLQSSVIVSGCKMHNIESVWVNITLICFAHYWPFTGHLQCIDVSIWQWFRGCITFPYAFFVEIHAKIKVLLHSGKRIDDRA